MSRSQFSKAITSLSISLLIISSFSSSTLVSKADTAKLIITEINNGVNSDLEWIEIKNLSANNIPIEQIRFIEAGIAHKITHPQTTEIKSQETMLIANKAELINNISSLSVLDSSWQSLSLDGETIALSVNDIIEDQFSYPSSSAIIDFTLHRQTDHSWMQKSATPLSSEFDEPAPTVIKAKNPLTATEISLEKANPNNILLELYIEDPNQTPTTNIYLNETLIALPTITTNFFTLKLAKPNTTDNTIYFNEIETGNSLETICFSTTIPNCLNLELLKANQSYAKNMIIFHNNETANWQLTNQKTFNQSNQFQNSAPIADFQIETGKSISTTAQVINLNNTSTDSDEDELTYNWFVNNQFQTSNKNLTFDQNKPSELIIKLIAIDPFGARSQIEKNFTYYQKPTPELVYQDKIIYQDKLIETKTNCSTTTSKATTSGANSATKTDNQINSIDPNLKNLRIQNLLPNPEGTDTNKESLTIQNIGNTNINIQNLIIKDLSKSQQKISESIVIPANQTYEFAGKNLKISLNNSNETIFLIAPSGEIIDQFSYEKSTEGQSINRDNFITSSSTNNPTPVLLAQSISDQPLKKTNTAAKIKTNKNTKTSKFKNGSNEAKISIMELLPNPKGKDENQEWIELFNNSEKPINLGNWQLIINDKTTTLPDSIEIPAQSLFLLKNNDQKFTLGNSETTLKIATFQDTISSELKYNKAPEDQSYSLIKTSTGNNWQWTKNKTPNQKNPELKTTTGRLMELNKNLQTLKFQTNNKQNLFTQYQKSTTDENLLVINDYYKISYEQTENINKLKSLTPITKAKINQPKNPLTKIIPLILIVTVIIIGLSNKNIRNYCKIKLSELKIKE